MPAMMLWHYFILLTLFGVPSVKAQDWGDFADNFATDLAPLVSLFGERLTKQFLAESTSRLDNLIFALCPLGILTAVVSLIRVLGNPSLRAFVGRANEAPGEAENELLSCVSEGTAELFNNGGISRVSGRPRILELIVWEEQGSHKLGTLRDALETRAWVTDGEEIQSEKGLFSRPELDIPNLSLNKGIKPRGREWFYLATFIGVALQGGTFIYAAMTVFWYSKIFKDDEDSADNYALPLYIYGSASLSLGMFLCALMIERSSCESYLYSAKPSKIYWLQPGRQTIGDQDFGAYLAVDEGPDSSATQDLTYIKSVRGPPPKGKRPLLIFTICVTMIGFVVQFIGLRGLHPSVIIADVGSTLTMAVVRTLLRTKRIGSDGNRFGKEDRETFSHNQQELDCFAYHLEGVESFRLVSSPVHQIARSRSGSCSTDNSSQSSTETSALGERLIQTRARLAELTSCNRHPSMDWDDLPIRKVAQDLARTIEMTIEAVSMWKKVPSRTRTYTFELSFACQSSNKSRGTPLETYPIVLTQSEDTLQWRVDTNELEAILGLWTFSLLKSHPMWLQNGLGRAVGLTKAEASAEATDLYFHKWIFRKREAMMVSSKMISFSEQTFGYYSDDHSHTKEILVVKTENNLEVMAAQDIYIQFLMSILAGLKSLGGGVDILPVSQDGFLAQSTSLEELVGCFETGNLGTREDALLCIVPVLKHQGLLPDLAGDTSTVREHVQKLISDENWDGAFSILQWLCQRCEDGEFDRSVYELGLLCQKAIISRNANIRDKGFKIVKSLLQCDTRFSFFENLQSPRPSYWMNSHIQRESWAKFTNQLGWVTWQIANTDTHLHGMAVLLEGLGFSEELMLQGNGDSMEQMDVDIAQLTILSWLIPNFDPGPHAAGFDHEDERCIEICMDWITKNAQNALCQWILARWAEVSQDYPNLVMKGYVHAARNNSDLAIRALRRQGTDIDITGNMACTALQELVNAGQKGAVERLLANGADANGCVEGTIPPLHLAAGKGDEEIALLLLEYGADLRMRDAGGFTPLRTACEYNQINTAALLLLRGADVNTAAVDTPLIAAAKNGNLEMVQFLVENGANIDATDDNGSTALMLAVSQGAEAVVRFLIGQKADTQKQDGFGDTALDLARKLGVDTAIVAMLEAAP
ncbi:hypothetical protein BJX76DRAFT_340953 [Aspergillus varians]